MAALAAYVRGGGGAFVFAGEQAAGLNPLLAALGGGAFTGIATKTPEAKVGRIDAAHPVFSGVFLPQPGQPPVEDLAVRRVATYRAGGGGERTLVALADGPPPVQEFQPGQGRALVVAVPPDPSWSDLPVRGLFVPLVLRGVQRLAARPLATSAETDASGSVAVPGRFARPLTLEAPDGVRTTPVQRAAGPQTVVTVGEGAPGLYRVYDGDSLAAVVAVNPDARESDLRALSPAAAAARLRDASGLAVETAEALTAAEVQGRRRPAEAGRELWPWLLGLAFGLLVCESLVSRRLQPSATSTAR